MVLHRVVPGHLPGVFQADDLGQGQLVRHRPVGRLRLLRRHGEPGVEPGKKLPGGPSLDSSMVLASDQAQLGRLAGPGRFPTSAPHVPWPVGRGRISAGMPSSRDHPGELGGLDRHRLLTGVVLEGSVAVAVEGQGDSPLADQALQEHQVAAGVLSRCGRRPRPRCWWRRPRL